MTDCPNAAVRDVLPDLLHDRLDATTRAEVEAHVASCADCREELALLRAAASVMRSAPRLDLAAIAAAVPAYQPARAPAHRSWVGWRTAAAITLMVAGGSSVLVLRRDVSPVSDSVSLPPSIATESLTAPAASSAPAAAGAIAPAVPSVVAPAPAPVAQSAPASKPAEVAQATTPSPGRELALSGGTLNELNEKELAMLLKEIESLDAVPTTDVDNNAISPIAPARRKP